MELQRKQLRPLSDFLEDEVSEEYTVTQPSILRGIGKAGTIKRTTVIKDLPIPLLKDKIDVQHKLLI